MAGIFSTASKIKAHFRGPFSPIPDIISDTEYRRLICTPAMTRGKATIFGYPIVFSDINGFLHSVREIFIEEVYRFASTEKDPRIIDAGANIGLSVIYFKRIFPESTVIAYEPDPDIFALLKENVGHLPGVELKNSAVWTEDTQLTFFSEGSLAGSTKLDLQHKESEITVRAERLKTLLSSDRTDFLKIDIEGAENDVIFDIEEELDRVENLFFEYHSQVGTKQMLGDLLNLVVRRGFRYVVSGAHGPTLPFVTMPDEGFDVQLNVSCVRLKPVPEIEANTAVIV